MTRSCPELLEARDLANHAASTLFYADRNNGNISWAKDARADLNAASKLVSEYLKREASK